MHWICFACEDDRQFPSEEAFISHNRTNHASTISADQLPLLASVCSRSAPTDIQYCPLCKWPEGEEGGVSKDLILDHISKEVHALSLRSLPWADDSRNKDDQLIQYCTEKVKCWLFSDKQPQRPYGTVRLAPDNINPTSSYFHQNPYFGGDSETTSYDVLDSLNSREMELRILKEERSSLSFDSKGSHTAKVRSDRYVNNDEQSWRQPELTAPRPC